MLTGELLSKPKTFSLSQAEVEALLRCIRSQVDWREGGCFGDGSNISDKVGFKSIQSVHGKIMKATDYV